jgi:hypothetical protein
MKVSFIFPIIDLRDLLPKEEHNKLPIEEFKNKVGGMVRNFGAKNNGFFCANNLIRFDDAEFQRKRVEGDHGVSRRYYCDDGYAVGRFEISLTKKNKKKVLSTEYIEEVLSAYANLLVKIDLNKEEERCRLFELQRLLPKAYYYSTVKKNNSGVKLDTLVKSGGSPICVVQLEQGEKITDENTIAPVNEEGLNLYYFDMSRHNLHLKVYVLELTSRDSRNKMKSFKDAISRINAEKEKIFRLNSFINDNELNNNKLHEDKEFKKKILNCLSKTGKNLLTNKKFGVKDNEILDFALREERNRNENDFDDMKRYVKDIQTTFSIELAQLLFDELDYEKIKEGIDEKIKDWRNDKDNESKLEKLEKLKELENLLKNDENSKCKLRKKLTELKEILKGGAIGR